MTHVLNLARNDDLFDHLRRLVEAGEPDGPVKILRDGKHSVDVRSLFAGALMDTAEEPRCRFVQWAPHPKFGKPPGPKMQALLDARAWWKAEEKMMRRPA